jgi:hypothetical protein
MKDFLQDLVAHTHTLGILPIVRVSSTPESTTIDALADDRSVLLNAIAKKPLENVVGVFGMPNLNKLDLHLKCPEYKENAKISILEETRGGETMPTGIHFENASGDFQNDYRFMAREIIDMKLDKAKFFGTKWDVEFQPSLASIQRFRLQSSAHTEESTFNVSTKNGNLIFSFGNLGTHAGSFVFQTDVSGTLKKELAWPKSQILGVLNLPGDKTFRIADSGAIQITVDSGIVEYNYTFKPIL